jgi:hypothetical protein
MNKVKSFKMNEHTFMVCNDGGPQLKITVDGGPTAKGYFFNDVMRFPKGIQLGNDLVTELEFDPQSCKIIKDVMN